jgi:hypothetical protein
MNLEIERAKGIIESINYATVATITTDGKPWNSPVFAVHDSELNFYWFSDKKSQHSRNVRANGNVFIAMYDSTVPEGKGNGLYLEARATEVEDLDVIRMARKLKKGPGSDDGADFMGDAVRRVYRAVPTRMWVNGVEIRDGVFIRDLRVEVPLAELKSAMLAD